MCRSQVDCARIYFLFALRVRPGWRGGVRALCGDELMYAGLSNSPLVQRSWTWEWAQNLGVPSRIPPPVPPGGRLPSRGAWFTAGSHCVYSCPLKPFAVPAVRKVQRELGPAQAHFALTSLVFQAPDPSWELPGAAKTPPTEWPSTRGSRPSHRPLGLPVDLAVRQKRPGCTRWIAASHAASTRQRET